jgi:hypothetical protein
MTQKWIIAPPPVRSRARSRARRGARRGDRSCAAPSLSAMERTYESHGTNEVFFISHVIICYNGYISGFIILSLFQCILIWLVVSTQPL